MPKAGNIDGDRLDDITVGTAETTIAHNLGRTPLEGFVLIRNLGEVIYRGSTAWTDTNIFLRASTEDTIISLLLI